jgi:hypothetical protein
MTIKYLEQLKHNIDTICWGREVEHESSQFGFDITLLAILYRKSMMLEPELEGLLKIKGCDKQEIEDIKSIVQCSFHPPEER